MPVTATNLIQGPATIYTGLFGATEPATISTTPSTGWTDVGGTKGGLELLIEQEWSELGVDQIVDVVGRRRTGRKVGIKTTLAEVTLANIAASIANSAPVTNVLELDNDITVFQPSYLAILFDGIGAGGFRRRVVLRKALPTENVSIAYKKDEQTVLAATWWGHYVSPSIKMLKIEDATS